MKAGVRCQNWPCLLVPLPHHEYMHGTIFLHLRLTRDVQLDRRSHLLRRHRRRAISTREAAALRLLGHVSGGRGHKQALGGAVQSNDSVGLEIKDNLQSQRI